MTTLMVLKFELKDVPKELAGHEASYDISYRAKKEYFHLESYSGLVGTDKSVRGDFA